MRRPGASSERRCRNGGGHRKLFGFEHLPLKMAEVKSSTTSHRKALREVERIGGAWHGASREGYTRGRPGCAFEQTQIERNIIFNAS